MRKQIPVSIGFHSGIGSDAATLEFRDEKTQQDFVNSMVDGTEFTVSVSFDRKLDGDHILREIRLIPHLRFTPTVEVSVAPPASSEILVCKHHAPGEIRCNMNNLYCTYPKCLGD